MTTLLSVEEISCQNCVHHVKTALEAVPGVTSVNVDLDAGKATVEHEGADVNAMITTLDDAGYPATVA